MKQATVEFDILTPCLCAGTDQKSAEIRAPSIRGALHWWYRVLNPGDRAGEQAVFGSSAGQSGRGSSLVTRVAAARGGVRCGNLDAVLGQPGRAAYLLWPLRSNERGFISPGDDVGFALHCTHRILRDGRELPDRVLECFALLGSLGTRSRRGFGSLWPRRLEIDGQAVPPPSDPDAFRARLQSLLGQGNQDFSILALSQGETTWRGALDVCGKYLHTFRCGKEFSGVRPSTWGQSDHDLPFADGNNVAYRAVLGLPLEQRYSRGRGTYSTRKNGSPRWASPLILKVISLCDNGARPFVPLAIFCNALAMSEDAECIIKGPQVSKNVRLSHALWDAMRQPDPRYWTGAVRMYGE